MGSNGEGDSRWRRTTILAVRRGDRVAVGGDGQVTLGQTVLKGDAVKLRRLLDGEVLVGFAGSTADAFALFERLEGKLRDAKGNLQRAAVELAKEWRTDRALRRLEAMLITASAEHLFVLSGTGDVLSPSDGILGIGSGGPFAVAAARALLRHTELAAPEIVRASLSIAGELCIYSNQNIVVEELPCRT